MKQRDYQSMKRLFLAIMILLPVVPFVSVLAIGYYYFFTSLETNTIAGMKRIVEDQRQMIDTFLWERKTDLGFIQQTHSFEEIVEPGRLEKIFEYLQQESNAFIDLGVFDAAGLHVAYQGPYKLSGRNYRDMEWFKEVSQKDYYISDIFLGFRQIPHFIIAVAKKERGRRWILRATIDTYRFNNLVKNARIGKSGEAYILNQEGLFQTERRSGGNLMEEDPDTIGDFTPHQDIRVLIKKDYKGAPYVYATTWLKNKNWMLVLRQEKADVFAALHSASYLILVIALLGGGIIIAAAFYATNRVIRRLEQSDREKDRLGQQLIRAGRLAELGEMAAGFAHEINNPLQIIEAEQDLIDTIISELMVQGALKDSPDITDMLDSMKQIKTQVGRCARITQAILKFGRKSEPVAKDIDLKGFLGEVIAMIEKRAGINGIHIAYHCALPKPQVHADPAQLQQVFVNLCNNAIDAVVARHGSAGGQMTITIEEAGAGKIKIAVSDNGCGISQENLNKLFMPFFTTKPIGTGTGLGLSVCYGIINSMRGTIEVGSIEGSGTTFTVFLPLRA